MKSDQLSQKLVSMIFNTGRLLREKFHQPDLIKPLWSFSLVHFEALRFISENKNATMKSLAGFLCIKPPSATAIVDQLAENKMIEREGDKNDRRSVILKISKSGKKFIEKRSSIVAGIMDKATNNLSAEEKKSLIKILEKISLNVK